MELEMVTIGDVFSIIATLVGLCITGGALVLGATLIFESRANFARQCCERSPWPSFLLGLVITGVLGIGSIALLSVPLPASKLLGTAVYLTLMALATVGASGVASLLSDRVSQMDSSLSRYASLLKACSILSIACVFPLIGWFLVTPLMLIFSVGFGARALVAKQTTSSMVSNVQG